MEALLWSWRRREFVSGGEFILQNQVTVVLFAMSHLEQLPPSSPAGRRDHYMLFIDTHEEFGLHFVVPCLCRYGRMDRTLLIPTFTTNVTVSLCPFCLSHSFFDVVVVFVSLSTSPQTSKNTSSEVCSTQTWTTRTTGSTLWVRASSHLFRKGSDHNDNNGDRKPWGSATVTCRSVNYSAFGFGFSFCAFA